MKKISKLIGSKNVSESSGAIFESLTAEDFEPFEFEPWPEEKLLQLPYEKAQDLLEIGDCIFLFSSSLISRGPEFFTHCNLSHVIQVHDIKKEESGKRKIQFVESSITKEDNGVQFYWGFDKWDKGHEIAWIFRLNRKHRKLLEKNLKDFLFWQKMKEKATYDTFGAVTSVFKEWPLLNALYNVNDKLRERPNDSFFCSGFVGAGLVAVNVIKTRKPLQWNLLTPEDICKMKIWSSRVVQIKGYGEKNEKIMPMDYSEFNKMTPDEWNNSV